MFFCVLGVSVSTNGGRDAQKALSVLGKDIRIEFCYGVVSGLSLMSSGQIFSGFTNFSGNVLGR